MIKNHCFIAIFAIFINSTAIKPSDQQHRSFFKSCYKIEDIKQPMTYLQDYLKKQLSQEEILSLNLEEEFLNIKPEHDAFINIDTLIALVTALNKITLDTKTQLTLVHAIIKSLHTTVTIY